jgi:hypothetical protein
MIYPNNHISMACSVVTPRYNLYIKFPDESKLHATSFEKECLPCYSELVAGSDESREAGRWVMSGIFLCVDRGTGKKLFACALVIVLLCCYWYNEHWWASLVVIKLYQNFE